MSEQINFLVEYEREPGLYSFKLVDGVPVTAIATSSWEEFHQTLDLLQPTTGYIVSPELITSPVPLSEIRGMIDVIEQRVAITQELSKKHPKAQILLGTAVMEEDGSLRNSMAVIRDGEIEGTVDKRKIHADKEARVFSDGSRRSERLLNVAHAALVCSDIVNASFRVPLFRDHEDDTWINPSVESILVSSCWAVPQLDVEMPKYEKPEDRYTDQLERTISGLFNEYSNLREVIMVDRAPSKSPINPYTSRFRRKEAADS